MLFSVTLSSGFLPLKNSKMFQFCHDEDHTVLSVQYISNDLIGHLLKILINQERHCIIILQNLSLLTSEFIYSIPVLIQ